MPVPRTEPRVVAAAIAAGFVALMIILASLLFVWGGILRGMPHIGATTAFIYWFALAIPVVLLYALLGVPALAYARRRGWSLWKRLLVAAALTAVLLPLGWIGIFGMLPILDTALFVATGALAGYVGSAIICAALESRVTASFPERGPR